MRRGSFEPPGARFGLFRQLHRSPKTEAGRSTDRSNRLGVAKFSRESWAFVHRPARGEVQLCAISYRDCQGWSRGFESPRPLQITLINRWIIWSDRSGLDESRPGDAPETRISAREFPLSSSSFKRSLPRLAPAPQCIGGPMPPHSRARVRASPSDNCLQATASMRSRAPEAGASLAISRSAPLAKGGAMT